MTGQFWIGFFAAAILLYASGCGPSGPLHWTANMVPKSWQGVPPQSEPEVEPSTPQDE